MRMRGQGQGRKGRAPPPFALASQVPQPRTTATYYNVVRAWLSLWGCPLPSRYTVPPSHRCIVVAVVIVAPSLPPPLPKHPHPGPGHTMSLILHAGSQLPLPAASPHIQKPMPFLTPRLSAPSNSLIQITPLPSPQTHTDFVGKVFSSFRAQSLKQTSPPNPELLAEQVFGLTFLPISIRHQTPSRGKPPSLHAYNSCYRLPT
ncbi:hypothetical protein LX36DRAFT_297809 [Colletotrichum falcatum]|nr:hypothetical protein LX36DRAFT_297809 [Colletotrichum falcatum]